MPIVVLFELRSLAQLGECDLVMRLSLVKTNIIEFQPFQFRWTNPMNVQLSELVSVYTGYPDRSSVKRAPMNGGQFVNKEMYVWVRGIRYAFGIVGGCPLILAISRDPMAFARFSSFSSDAFFHLDSKK